MKHRTPAIVLAAIVASVALTAGACDGQDDSTTQDQQTTSSQADIYGKAQPLPRFDYSQYRQTLIDVESAEANSVATTSFFYNLGSSVPIKSCPSIGFPLPSTAQLTNPQQVVGSNQGSGITTIGQQEMTGVFTGDSSGTYVVCVTSQGPSIAYWEGDVETEGGPAHYDTKTGQIVLDGAPTVKVKTK